MGQHHLLQQQPTEQGAAWPLMPSLPERWEGPGRTFCASAMDTLPSSPGRSRGGPPSTQRELQKETKPNKLANQNKRRHSHCPQPLLLMTG